MTEYIKFLYDNCIYKREEVSEKYIDNGNIILFLEHPILKKFFYYKMIYGVREDRLVEVISL